MASSDHSEPLTIEEFDTRLNRELSSYREGSLSGASFLLRVESLAAVSVDQAEALARAASAVCRLGRPAMPRRRPA